MAREPAVTKPRFLSVDFFCGAGGTTRGLIDAKGYVIAGIDNDVRCRDTFTKNNFNACGDYSQVRFLEYDIFPKSEENPQGQQSELFAELDKLIQFYRRKFPKIPLLFAICAPCQPFTTVSKKALSDRKIKQRQRDKNLLAEALKFVKKFGPEYVLSENVAGIQSSRYGGVWGEFQRGLNKLKYLTGTKVVCTSQFGIPQYRKRSILLAAKLGCPHPPFAKGSFWPELDVPDSDIAAEQMTVESAIGHYPAIEAGEHHPSIHNHRTRSLSELNIQRISVAKPGESNKYMETSPLGDLSLSCHKKVNEKLGVRCFNDVYTRMTPDQPSPTITTKCHSISNGRFGHYDIKQNRGISLREAATLQSFPDDYVFYPEQMIEPIARMIGNAVPPKLATFFASYLVDRETQQS